MRTCSAVRGELARRRRRGSWRKRSTARIPKTVSLAGSALSCTEIAAGSSMDVHELDAASNNGVEAMRDLVARAALGTPGRWKVYIVDEVHMLTPAASNALLKTLEEPPAHVVFVLATTDPQKVLPTIRSRTQHFEFRLLGPETLGGLLDTVRAGAGLDLPDEALEVAVRRGKGSARDALSVLDQIAAAGIVEPDSAFIDQLAEALAIRDAQGAMVALAGAVASGRDPLGVAGELADRLRQGFLTVVAPDLAAVSGTERSTAEDLAQKMGLAALVRAIEALGTVQVEMRESPDPRLHVEVCLSTPHATGGGRFGWQRWSNGSRVSSGPSLSSPSFVLRARRRRRRDLPHRVGRNRSLRSRKPRSRKPRSRFQRSRVGYPKRDVRSVRCAERRRLGRGRRPKRRHGPNPHRM